MSNYSTKKELEHATGIDTCNLAAKSDFIALKPKVYINELVKVPTGFHDSKSKVGGLDIVKTKYF